MGSTRLSNVAYVILGFLSSKGVEPKSGYDIKQLIDISVRFFFAASYGQIYPELKKLSAAGLIEGTDEPTGGRARTTYTITDAGREALREWLLQSESQIEMRDQGILRIFFSGPLTKEERLTKIRQLREERAANLAVLKAIEVPPEAVTEQMPDLVLNYGLGLHQYVIDWCDWATKQLESN